MFSRIAFANVAVSAASRLGGIAESTDAALRPIAERARDGWRSTLAERLADLANRVRRFVLRFVVRAGLHLGEQADGHELHAGEDQDDAEQEQGAIRQRVTTYETPIREIAADQEPDQRHHAADQTEDVQRTRRIAQ